MPFYVIKGRFKPTAGAPDGDSLRFAANDNALWSSLKGRPVKLGTGKKTAGTVQLRLEGIDAIEKAAQQPLAGQAAANLKRLLGSTGSNPEPDGYILSRMTDDLSGRPICFAFAGETSDPDGAEVFLSPALLRKSANWQQIRDGFAYPLYYNTLFAALRNEFNKALKEAKAKKRGYWPKDKTIKGVPITGSASLAAIDPIWPKLWRRLEEYLRDNDSLSGFIAFLDQKNERVDLLDIMEERGLQDVVSVNGNKVRLLTPPENIRVRGKAGRRLR